MKLTAWVVTLLLAFFANCSNAQFSVSYSPKDAFSYALIKLLNAAPSGFEKIKGKKLQASDSSATFYTNKIALPKTEKRCFVLKNSLIVASYSFGSFTELSSAEPVMIRVTKDISTALMQHVLIKNFDVPQPSNMIRQTQIAYVASNGFYDDNITIAIIKDSAYHVVLNILGGEPVFYYTIPAMPVRSGYFNAGFLGNAKAFINNTLYGCSADMPGFSCNTIKDSSFIPVVQYVKYDDSEPHAQFEFDNALANIKCSLGPAYIYYLTAPDGDILKTATFIKKEDVDQLERKRITLKLSRTNDELYELAIDFTPNSDSEKTIAKDR